MTKKEILNKFADFHAHQVDEGHATYEEGLTNWNDIKAMPERRLRVIYKAFFN